MYELKKELAGITVWNLECLTDNVKLAMLTAMSNDNCATEIKQYLDNAQAFAERKMLMLRHWSIQDGKWMYAVLDEKSFQMTVGAKDAPIIATNEEFIQTVNNARRKKK